MPTKKVVRVSCTCVADAESSPATCGNAGTYRSVASGAIAVRKITVAISPEVSATWRRATGGAGTEVSEGTRPAQPGPAREGSHRRWVYRQGIPRRSGASYRRGHGQPSRGPRVPHHAPREDQPGTGRAAL